MATNIIGRLVYQITGDSSRLNNALGESDKKVGALGRGLKRIGLAVAGAFAVGKVVQFGTALVKSAGEFEQLNVAFETFLGDADKAVATLAELEDFSVVTPFTINQVNQAGKSLLAFGFEADELTDRLQKIGNISAGTGKDFNELATLVGKARVQTTIYSEDINQFTEAGIPIIEEFAEILGVSTSEVKKLASEGSISFDTLDTALNNLSTGSGQFAGLIEAQSETLLGRISTLQGNFQLLGRTIGEQLVPVVGFFVDGLNSLITAEDTQSDQLRENNLLINRRINLLKNSTLDEEAREKVIGDVNKQLEELGLTQIDNNTTLKELNSLQKQSNDLFRERIRLAVVQEQIQEKENEALQLERDNQQARNRLADVGNRLRKSEIEGITARIEQRELEIDQINEEIENLIEGNDIKLESDTALTDGLIENSNRLAEAEVENEERKKQAVKQAELEKLDLRRDTVQAGIAVAQAGAEIAIALSDKILTEEQKNSDAGIALQKSLFLLTKGLSIAQAIIFGELAKIRIVAEQGTIGLATQRLIDLQTIASVALIGAQTIAGFQDGGVIRGLNGPAIGAEDGLIAVQNNESVLTRRATQEVGEDGVNALNSGGGIKNIIQFMLNNQVIEEYIFSGTQNGTIKIDADSLVNVAK